MLLGFLIVPGFFTRALPMTPSGMPIVPSVGHHIEQKGRQYKVVDVVWDLDNNSVRVEAEWVRDI